MASSAYIGHLIGKAGYVAYKKHSAVTKTKAKINQKTCEDSCKVMDAKYVQFNEDEDVEHQCLCYMEYVSKFVWIFDYNAKTQHYSWEFVPEK